MTSRPSKIQRAAPPCTSTASRTSRPVPAAAGPTAVSVTFQASAGVRRANSRPLAAVVPERTVAIDHGVVPLAGTSRPRAVQRAASTTLSKRAVTSSRKSVRWRPKVIRVCWFQSAELPTRRPFSIRHGPSTAVQPAGRPGPSKCSSTTTSPGAAAAGATPGAAGTAPGAAEAACGAVSATVPRPSAAASSAASGPERATRAARVIRAARAVRPSRGPSGPAE